MNTARMAVPALYHRLPRCTAARVRRWVLAVGLLSGADVVAHPYGPFGLPIFLPPPPPPAFLRPAPVFVPAPAPDQSQARRAQRPQAPPPAAGQPARIRDAGIPPCAGKGVGSQGCAGEPHGERRIASEFRAAAERP